MYVPQMWRDFEINDCRGKQTARKLWKQCLRCNSPYGHCLYVVPILLLVVRAARGLCVSLRSDLVCCALFQFETPSSKQASTQQL